MIVNIWKALVLDNTEMASGHVTGLTTYSVEAARLWIRAIVRQEDDGADCRMILHCGLPPYLLLLFERLILLLLVLCGTEALTAMEMGKSGMYINLCICVCMHVCMYAWGACQNVCMYVSMHECMDECIHGSVYVFLYECIYIIIACTCECIYVNLHVYVWLYVYRWSHVSNWCLYTCIRRYACVIIQRHTSPYD